jgi:werner syndrome ATP-dependent helicase
MLASLHKIPGSVTASKIPNCMCWLVLVTCGEFCVQPPPKQCELSETIDTPTKPEKRLKMLKEPLEQGPTIIYVPTRKDTVRIAKYLCKSGVKAAAYNAGV